MSGRRILAGALVVLLTCTVSTAAPTTNAEQNREMLQRLQAAHDLSPAQMKRIEADLRGRLRDGPGQPGDRAASDDAGAVPREVRAQARRLREPGVRTDLRRQVHGAAVRPAVRHASAGEGLHRPVRIPGHALRVPGHLGQGARGGRDLRGAGQAPVRRPRMGGRVPGPARAAGLPVRSRGRREPERRRRAHARGAQPRPRRNQALELRAGISTRRVCGGQLEIAGLPGRWVEPVRLEHLSGRELSRLPQPARCVRPERQRGRAHEPAAQSFTDVEHGQHDARLHRDEGQLVHLRHVPRARGLVSLARTVLARQPGHGPAQPFQLSPGFSLLQDAEQR